MKQRVLAFAAVIAALAAAVSLLAQTPASQPASTTEKLYISLETTDTLAVVDLKTFKHIKTLKVGMHPHGQASPASQDKLYVAAEIGGTVTLIDTIRDEVVKTFDVGFGVEPQNGAITPDGRFLYQPSYAGYWQVFDTQKEQIIEYIHTLGIGHNTVMAPDGRFAYLLPIAGGPGHFARPSLGLPRTQPKEVTVVDAQTHKVVGTIPTGTGPAAGHDQPRWQAPLHERRRSDGVPRHRYGGAQSHLEGDLHAHAG